MPIALVFIALIALLSIVLAMSGHTAELSTVLLVLEVIVVACGIVWLLRAIGVSL